MRYYKVGCRLCYIKKAPEFYPELFLISDDVQLQHYYGGGKDDASDDVQLQLYGDVDDHQF
jgi:hypothetical protein